MRLSDHIIADYALLEMRGVRLWNLSASDMVAGAVADTDQQPRTVLGNGSGTILGSAHTGLAAFHTGEATAQFFDGTAWRRTSRPYRSGTSFPDFTVTTGNLLRGVSGVMDEVAPSAIPLSSFGAAAADVSLGGFKITSLADPVSSTDAASKQYVDNVAQGIQPKAPAALASTQALPSCVYDGAAGTLEASAAGSALNPSDIDASPGGVTLTAGAEGTGTRVLIKNQATSYQNGIYRLSTQGSVGVKWKLTRVADSDIDAELRSAYLTITGGSQSGTSWVQQTPTSGYAINPGSGTIVFVLFQSSSVYSAGNGIDITGSTISAKIGGATTWTANRPVVTGASNTLSTVATSVTRSPFWFDGSAMAFGAYGFPSTVAAGDILYASSSSLLAPVANKAASRVLVTDGSSIPTWSSDLPAATTIGGKTPFFTTDLIPIGKGGTGKDHSTSGEGAVLYKVDTQFVASLTTPVVGAVPICTRAPSSGISAIIDMVNIFGRLNSWTVQQTFLVGSGSTAIAVGRSGDTNARFSIDNDGPSGGSRMTFGIGSSAPDVGIRRESAYTLGIFASDVNNSASLQLQANQTVSGTGRWRASIVEVDKGGTGSDGSGWAVGSMIYKAFDGKFTAMGGTNASGKFPVSSLIGVNWSAYTLPSAATAGDLWYASDSSTITALAKPGSDAYVLGLSSGIPSWKPLGSTSGTGTNGSGGLAGVARKWSTRYNGTGALSRSVTFNHGLGTRDVVANARRTNSADTLNPSEIFVTRVDVVDTNQVRVWFAQTPTASDDFVITVVG